MRKILSLILGLMWALPSWAGTSSDYTKLEYIESTGTQYIDTGYKFSAGNKFEVVLNPLNNLQTWFFGANSGGGEVLFSNGSIYFGSSFRPSTASTSGLFPTTNTIYKITGDMRGASSNQSSLLIDDNLIWQGTSTFNNRKIYLFAVISSANDESSLARQKIRIYGFKIWQNDTIVQDLIPVKRHSDGVICMYDMVTGEFFENIGTGTFVAGPVAEIKIATTKYNESAFGPLNTALANAISVVDTVVSNTITQAGRIATLQAQKQTRPNDIADDNEKCPAGKKCLLVEDASGIPHWYEIVTSILPDGYTELQYIESTGTQYIDTGWYISSEDVAIQTRVMITSTATTEQDICGNQDGVGDRFVFGSWNGGGEPTWFLYTRSGNASSSTNATMPYTSNVVTNLEAYIKNGQKWIVKDGVSSTKQVARLVSNSNQTVSVFKDGTGALNFIGRIYYLRLTDNGTLVRDFVPAKNASGKIGMYDLVGGRFYENQGTDEFIAGDPVAE